MPNNLTTQQKGRCGELLVQYVLLKHGIESAPLTTDTGIDLVVYPRTATSNWPADKPVTIQIKTSTYRGSATNKWLEWNLPNNCPADYVSIVDLERNKVWFFKLADFKSVATKSGEQLRLWWPPPEYDYPKAPRHESDFAKYEIDKGIRNAFGLPKP